ncbi:hypothetical protein ACER0A_007550 [Haloimpatiens sp. FM7315]|uniref:hypothetical protein n=1 Tax=Haloimpatiens sp. FM7315 TaxID=3298609 RepID=UPI00370C97B3
MRSKNKVLTGVALVLLLNIVACNKSNKVQVRNVEKDKEEFSLENIKLPKIIVISDKDKSNELYKLDNLSLNKIGDFKDVNLLDFHYDIEKKVYVALVNNVKDSGQKSSEVEIKTIDKNYTLKNSAVYCDIKISPDSKRIAFRSFKDKNLTEPEGLRVYDINSQSEVKLNSKVLVSGSVYEWLDENNVIYYGIIPEEKNSNKIYKYNILTKEESVYFDKLNGYCLNALPIKSEGILLLENCDEDYKLSYYNEKTKEKNLISENLSQIGKAVLDENNNIVYFVGKNVSTDNFSLFSVNLCTFEISQLTYDLPKNVDINSGIALDKNNNVLFCGKDSINNNDVYFYDVKNKSTNLITEVTKEYKIFKDN